MFKSQRAILYSTTHIHAFTGGAMATHARAARLLKARARVTQKSARATSPLLHVADGIFPRRCCTIVAAASVFSDEQRDEAVAAENELLLDESAGSGSGGSSDDTDCRVEEKREEDRRELWAFMLQVGKTWF